MPHAALWVVQRRSGNPINLDCDVSMPHAALWVVQPVVGAWEMGEKMEVSMPHAALWVVQHRRSGYMVRHRRCFNAARGFVGGAARNQSWAFSLDTVSMPHAALWVVQRGQESTPARAHILFQCRTRLCGWCSYVMAQVLLVAMSFNAARGFVGGAAKNPFIRPKNPLRFQCRTRLCGWCSGVCCQ